MKLNTKRNIGNAGLSMAIAYFGANGYTVSVPLNDTQDYDLIVDMDGALKKIQVKATKPQRVERFLYHTTKNGERNDPKSLQDSG